MSYQSFKKRVRADYNRKNRDKELKKKLFEAKE